VARALGLAESSIKRMFAKGDMTLARIDAVLGVLKMDFAELARKVADARALRRELTLEQERAVVADRKLLLMALSCLSLWSVEQIVATYRVSEAEAVKHLVALDRLGVIELRPGNRYRLNVAKTFRWRPAAASFDQRLARLAQDFAQQHLADQTLSPAHKRPFTLVIGMRSWLFSLLRELKR
jgi:hypothetical protein